MGIFTFSTRHSLIGSITVLVALCMLLIGACRKPDLEPAAALTIAEAGAQNDLPTVVTVDVMRILNRIVVTGRVERHGSSFVDSVGICFGTDTLPTFMAIQTLRLSIPRDTIPWNFRDTINSMNAVTYVRAFATNVHGTAYGEELLVGDVVVTTGVVNNTTDTSATISGSVAGSGVGERGIRYAPMSSQTQPTDMEAGSGSGNFNVELTGLAPATTYLFWAYAYESGTIVLGDQHSFRTNRCPSVLTYWNGNEYIECGVVDIGERCWMAENLKTRNYSTPADLIPVITLSSSWNTDSIGAKSFPNGDSNLADSLGFLYNWYAVNNTRGLCPAGWVVPSSQEWTTLQSNFEANATALKDSSWSMSTNASGFSALPAGERGVSGYSGVNTIGTWWSSTQSSDTTSYSFSIPGEIILIPQKDKRTGLSVRCIKSQ